MATIIICNLDDLVAERADVAARAAQIRASQKLNKTNAVALIREDRDR